MPTRLPRDDGAGFIAMLELASASGEADIIEANMPPRLEDLIAQDQERIHELAKLEHAARVIRGSQESPAPSVCGGRRPGSMNRPGTGP